MKLPLFCAKTSFDSQEVNLFDLKSNEVSTAKFKFCSQHCMRKEADGVYADL